MTFRHAVAAFAWLLLLALLALLGIVGWARARRLRAPRRGAPGWL